MPQQKSPKDNYIPFQSEIRQKASLNVYIMCIRNITIPSLIGISLLFWGLVPQDQPAAYLSQEKIPAKSVVAADLDNVYAIGYGKTQDAAIGDTQKIVRLQEYGAFVSAETEVQGFILVKDRILLNIQGFIASTKILESLSPEQTKSE